MDVFVRGGRNFIRGLIVIRRKSGWKKERREEVETVLMMGDGKYDDSCMVISVHDAWFDW